MAPFLRRTAEGGHKQRQAIGSPADVFNGLAGDTLKDRWQGIDQARQRQPSPGSVRFPGIRLAAYGGQKKGKWCCPAPL